MSVDFEHHPYTLDDMAADTITVLDAVGLDSVHLVGMSMGGVISQLVALGWPGRVRSLTLLSTTPGPDDRLSPPAERLMNFEPPPADNEMIDGLVEFSRILAGDGYPFDEPRVRALVVADVARGLNPTSAHGTVLNTSPSRVEALAVLRAPTLVIHGTDDPIFAFVHAEALAGAIPDANLVRLEGVGHDQPSDVVPELTSLIVDHIGAGE